MLLFCSQLEQENRKIQQGGVPADETATDMGQCDEQDCDEVGMGNATSSQSGQQHGHSKLSCTARL